MSGPRLLVAGADRVDAGKTTVSTGLLAHLAASGAEPVGVKPRAGNDFWFDHDDVRAAVGDARLYGKDARRLAAASAGRLPQPGANNGSAERSAGPAGSVGGPTDAADAPDGPAPEAINPVHRLWRPTPGRTGLLGESDRTFLLDRVSTPSGPSFVVNGRAEADGLLPALAREALPIADARRVRDVEGFNGVMADRHLPAVERLADRVRAASGPVVIESHGDVAYPLDVAVDAVAVVAPTEVRVYAGDRYERARRVASGSPEAGRLEERTGTVTGMIEPLATVGLPALSGDARSDPARVADAYRPAVEAVVDAA